MFERLRIVIIRNLVSPLGLALFSYFLFLFAWAFPPELYTLYLREPDVMFLDPSSLLFVSACVLAFMLSSYCVTGLAPSSIQTPESVTPSYPVIYLSIPVILSSFFCLAYLLKMGSHIDFVSLLASSQGNSIKLANQTGQLNEGFWGRSPAVLCGALWWAQYRSGQLRMKGLSFLVFTAIFLGALSIYVATCTATLNRTNLMPMLSGIVLIYLFRKTRTQSAKLGRLVGFGVLAASCFLGVFLLLSFFRGDTKGNMLIMSLLGYGIASYNRLALMLSGHLQLATAGTGVYLCPLLLQSSAINALTHLSDRLGWPGPDALWRMEFLSIASSGLNRAFNWVSLFGYIYSDLGWLAPVYASGGGLVVGRLWLSFTKGRPFGLVLYPWAAFGILFWCGYNVAFDARVIALIEAAFAIGLWDFLLGGVRVKSEASPASVTNAAYGVFAATGLRERF